MAAQAAVSPTVREEYQEAADQTRLSIGTTLPSFLVSLVTHLLLLLILALWVVPSSFDEGIGSLLSRPVDVNSPTIDPPALDDLAVVDQQVESLAEMSVATQVELAPAESSFADLPFASFNVVAPDAGPESLDAAHLLSSPAIVDGAGFEGRGAASRQALVAQQGGNDYSEAAVALGLEWLARHQNPDGSWSFNHQGGACKSRCDNPGTHVAARNAATGLGLLPFLGAGQTHREGKYRKNIQKGLVYLTNHMRIEPNGGNMTDPQGNMYSQGLAAIALCEAYAMSKDPKLMAPAQQALNFIIFAQDEVGGGWRYTPNQPGDTSVVGWQVMALRSGELGYLIVPPQAFAGAAKFLDSVQTNGGASYGYDVPGSQEVTSSVGLLCRMYLGWDRGDPALVDGVSLLSQRGPSTAGQMYYNYYATQVLHHYEGQEWVRWNDVMRDFLIDSQKHEGHERGSWFFANSTDLGEGAGGRLYFTSMATMTLEVYYRHLPLYRKQSFEVGAE